MTKWKDEIDVALGMDPKFSDALQNKIVKKATKRTFHWRYAVTAVSFVLVALLLFLTGPTQVEQEVTAVTPFEQLIEQAQVDQFFMSSKYTEPDQFFARDSSRYMQVHAFKESQDTNAMQDFLHAMTLVESSESLWGANDVVVVMSNGEQLKIKIVREPTFYLVQDVYSKLMYKVALSDAKSYESWKKQITDSNLGFWAVLLLFGVIIIISFVSEKWMNVPKVDKGRKWNWKSFFIMLAIIIPINLYSNYTRNEYALHIDVHFAVVALGMIGIQFITQKQEMPYKKKVLDWVVVGVLLLFIWLLLNFG